MVNVTFLLLELILADQMAGVPPVESSCGEFYISAIRTNIGRSTGRSTPHSHLMVNVTFLLLQLILADQVRDLPPIQVESCCGEEWQIYISTFAANNGRSTGRCTTQ